MFTSDSSSDSSGSSFQSFPKRAGTGTPALPKEQAPSTGTPLSHVVSQMTVLHSMTAGCMAGFMVGQFSPEIVDFATSFEVETDTRVDNPFEKDLQKCVICFNLQNALHPSGFHHQGG